MVSFLKCPQEALRTATKLLVGAWTLCFDCRAGLERSNEAPSASCERSRSAATEFFVIYSFSLFAVTRPLWGPLLARPFFFDAPRRPQRRPQDASKIGLDVPKTPRDAPNTPPSRPNTPPGRAQTPPRRPKTPQDAQTTRLNAPKTSGRRPKTLQDAFRDLWFRRRDS